MIYMGMGMSLQGGGLMKRTMRRTQRQYDCTIQSLRVKMMLWKKQLRIQAVILEEMKTMRTSTPWSTMSVQISDTLSTIYLFPYFILHSFM